MNVQCFRVQGKMPATRTRLKFNSTRESSQDRRLHWLSHREMMQGLLDECAMFWGSG